MIAPKNKDCNNFDSFELQIYTSFPERSIESAANGCVRPQILDKARIEILDNYDVPQHSKQKKLEWLNLDAKEMRTSEDKLRKCRLKSPKIRRNNGKTLDEKNSTLTMNNNKQIEGLDLHVYETMTSRNIYQNGHTSDFENPSYECMSDWPENIENISELECLPNQTYEFVEAPKRSFHCFQNRCCKTEGDLKLGNSKESYEKRVGVATFDWKSRCVNKLSDLTSYDDNLPPEESPATLPTDLPCTRIVIPLPNDDYYPPSEENVYEELNEAGSSTTAEIFDSIVENNDVLSENLSQVLLKDESLGFLQKLRYAKATCSFCDYATFAVYLLYKEVGGYIFLDLYYMIIGLCIEVFGGIDFYKCQLSEHLPFLAAIFGALAMLTSSIKFSLTCLKWQRSLSSCLSSLSTILRVFMALFSIAGIYEVVICYPPNVQDSGSPNYCSPLIYWSATYAFVLNVLIYFVIFVHGMIIILWYCV